MTIRFALLSLLSIAACTSAVHPEPARQTAPAAPAAPATRTAPRSAPSEALPFGVRVTGHGPPMILIPGLASSGDVWTTTVAHEQARFTCRGEPRSGSGPR